MITGGEVKLYVEGLTQRSEEVRDKLRSAVGSNMGQNSMLGKNVKDKELG
jgi:hypothetical protein